MSEVRLIGEYMLRSIELEDIERLVQPWQIVESNWDALLSHAVKSHNQVKRLFAQRREEIQSLRDGVRCILPTLHTKGPRMPKGLC